LNAFTTTATDELDKPAELEDATTTEDTATMEEGTTTLDTAGTVSVELEEATTEEAAMLESAGGAIGLPALLHPAKRRARAMVAVIPIVFFIL
jgi:hypothetical protein